MKMGFVVLATATLIQTPAMAQSGPILQIASQNGNATVSWVGGSTSYSLQATTNLLKPVTWTDQQRLVNPAGTQNMTAAGPQQFFRLAPIAGIFQFAIFYNVNLEIDPGAVMSIAGPVFCNQNIWEGSSICTFASTVTAAGTNSTALANPFANGWLGSGGATFALAGQPISHAPPLALAGLGTNASPGTMRSILELPPPDYAMGTAAAYGSNGLVYLANACDLVITNFASGTNSGLFVPKGTNLMVYFQDHSLTRLPYDYYMITNGNSHKILATNYVGPSLLGPNTNIYYAGYSWVTNVAFYDWREGYNGGSGPPKRVEAVQIDMAKLNTWLNNYNNNTNTSGYNSDQTKLLHTGNHINSLYVYASVQLTSLQLPAVRVVNGAFLPHPGGSTAGFTVATPFPLYVLGDYNSQDSTGSSLGTTNTIHTLPAALMADAITVLSDSWQDSSSFTPNNTPSSTTVNAAMLQGIVAGDPAVYQDYSGGVENFLRLLENWSSSTVLTFNGSLVVPFYSQYATNHWRFTGIYYNPPKRNWSFDSNFANFTKLPPLTPFVVNYVSP